jgi:hypothetical protein
VNKNKQLFYLNVKKINIPEIKKFELSHIAAYVFHIMPDAIVTYHDNIIGKASGVIPVLSHLRDREQGNRKRALHDHEQGNTKRARTGGGTYIVLEIKGRKIRKKLYTIDGKQKVRIHKNNYVSVQTYKKIFLI